MNINEASEWAEELGSQVKWVWWYFQSRQVMDGPHWYVEAVNKINGKKHDLWKKGDEKALVSSIVPTGNINSPEEACVYLARCLPQEQGRDAQIDTLTEEKITDDDFDTPLGLARIKFIEIVRTSSSYIKGELSADMAIKVIVGRAAEAVRQINTIQTEKGDKK